MDWICPTGHKLAIPDVKLASSIIPASNTGVKCLAGGRSMNGLQGSLCELGTKMIFFFNFLLLTLKIVFVKKVLFHSKQT